MTLTARELMDRLVGFPTVSRDSNLELIDFVENYLNDLGVPSTRVPNEEGTKAALYAHVGPKVDGGVVLSGHTDVVPVGDDVAGEPLFEGEVYVAPRLEAETPVALQDDALPFAIDIRIRDRPFLPEESHDARE